MQPEFWHERWQRNQIGFHQKQANGLLERYLPTLPLTEGGAVFVPLCGKSVDMVRLHQAGLQVVGVELSLVAVASFFSEHRIAATPEAEPPFTTFHADGYRIHAGDFFALDRVRLGPVQAVYDRAALVALPPPMRIRYARHMATLVTAGTPILLLTHEYPQQEMPGPPFSVPAEEVEALFAEAFAIRSLEQRDVLAAYPQFRNRGVTAFAERAWILVRR